MSRSALPLVACLALSGCFRLTDPVWAFKSLRAPEPDVEGSSLVFGSFEVEGGFFGLGAIDTVVLRRVRPGPGEEFSGVTEEFLFRGFQRRPMKDGHFLLDLTPGVYELVQLVGSRWGQSVTLVVTEDARVSSRFAVTRPGIYDVGVLSIRSGSGLGAGYRLSHLPGSERPERQALLRDAIAGTAWQRFLPE